MDNIGGDAARVVEANSLGGGLDGSDRITLTDNNGNLVDVVDSTDSVDPQTGVGQQQTWQKDDPTTDDPTRGAGEKQQTALNYNSSTDPLIRSMA